MITRPSLFSSILPSILPLILHTLLINLFIHSSVYSHFLIFHPQLSHSSFYPPPNHLSIRLASTLLSSTQPLYHSLFCTGLYFFSIFLFFIYYYFVFLSIFFFFILFFTLFFLVSYLFILYCFIIFHFPFIYFQIYFNELSSFTLVGVLPFFLLYCIICILQVCSGVLY